MHVLILLRHTNSLDICWINHCPLGRVEAKICLSTNAATEQVLAVAKPRERPHTSRRYLVSNQVPEAPEVMFIGCCLNVEVVKYCDLDL